MERSFFMRKNLLAVFFFEKSEKFFFKNVCHAAPGETVNHKSSAVFAHFPAQFCIRKQFAAVLDYGCHILRGGDVAGFTVENNFRSAVKLVTDSRDTHGKSLNHRPGETFMQ